MKSHSFDMTKKEYNQLHVDVWDFHKKYLNPTDDEDYWMDIVEEARKLVYKYNDTPFIRGMVVQTICEIERVRRGKAKLREKK